MKENMVIKFKKRMAILLLLACTIGFTTSAQVPFQFAYQGRLTDSNGVPVVGVVTADFAIVKGGSATSDGVTNHLESGVSVTTDVNGVFSHVLGVSPTIDLADLADGSADARYLQATVGGQALLPRQQMLAVPYAAVAGAAVGSGANILINGGLDFWQRGTNFSGYTYGADRWLGGAGATTYAKGVGSPSARTVAHARIAGSGFLNIAQRIESANTRMLDGQQVTISFKARHPAGTDPFYVQVVYPTIPDNYGVSNVMVSYQPLGVGSTSAWQTFPYTFEVSSAMASNGFQVAIGNFSAGANTYEIGEVMLNEGSVALPFRRAGNSIAEELAICQRYYEKSYNIEDKPGTLTHLGIREANIIPAIFVETGFPFLVRKRVIPLMQIYDPTTGAGNALFNWRNTVTYTGVATGAGYTGETGFRIYSVTGLPAGAAIAFHFTADAEL